MKKKKQTHDQSAVFGEEQEKSLVEWIKDYYWKQIVGWIQRDEWGVCRWQRKQVINQGKGLQRTETANRLAIKFCEYGGCSFLIVEKCCSNVLKTKALVSIFVKVRCFSFIALTSLFGH